MTYYTTWWMWRYNSFTFLTEDELEKCKEFDSAQDMKAQAKQEFRRSAVTGCKTLKQLVGLWQLDESKVPKKTRKAPKKRNKS